MTTKTIDPLKETEPIVAMVRRFKEEHAAEFDFNVRRIAQAARKAQREHPEIVVDRSRQTVTPRASDGE